MQKVRAIQTRLSCFAEGLIEAGWLAVVAILPMLFNPYTERGFVVPKACMLRAIALVTVLAWGVKTLEERKAGAGRTIARRMADFLGRPLVPPALALALAYILSTVLSVWPHGSLWGSYERYQGTYTALCQIGLFLLVLYGLRTRAQLERVTTLIVVASLPVCLYALAQHSGLSWAAQAAIFGRRVDSSLGNPIFLGAYVIMVMPLTLSKVIASVERIRGSEKGTVAPWISVAFYALLLFVQSLTLILTVSRGPVLAFVVGLFLFALLYLGLRGRRWRVVLAMSLALAAGLFLVALNLPNTPLKAVKDLRYVRRLTRIADSQTLTMRTLIWEGAVRMSTATPLRTLFGYGPETVGLVYYPYLTPELVESQGSRVTADSSHNEILDTWATAGLTGVAAQLVLFGSAFCCGLRWLGLTDSHRQRIALRGMMAGGGLLGAVIPCVLDGTLRFSGLGVSLGLLLGLLVYLAFALLGDRPQRTGRSMDLPLIALLSAIVAHFVEIQTGISITVTRTQFWVYAALIGASGALVEGERVVDQGQKDRRAEMTDYASLMSSALSIGLVFVTMAFALVRQGFSSSAPAYIVAMFLIVWILAGAGLMSDLGDKAAGPRSRTRLNRFLIYSIGSLGSLLVFVPFHAANLGPSLGLATLAPTYYVFVFLLMFCIAASLLAAGPVPRHFSQNHWWIHPVLILIAGGVLIRTSLNVVKADLYGEVGRRYAVQQDWDQSIALQKRAVELAPGEDRLYQYLGQTYLGQARLAPGQTSAPFEEAREALEVALQLSPLNPDHHADLGRLYSAWAEATTDPQKKTERLAQAVSYLSQARSMAPLAHGEHLREVTLDAHVALAQSYEQLGMAAEAIEELEAAELLGSPEKQSELREMISRLEDQTH